MLLQSLKNDLQLAIEGTVESYHGLIPHISSSETIRIYRELVLRRMRIVEDRLANTIDNADAIKREF